MQAGFQDRYVGRLFGDLDVGGFESTAEYDAFFEYGVGAMCWKQDPEGRRQLLFYAPWPEPYQNGVRGFCTLIYCQTDGQDWKVPGPVNGWNGNAERPTFQPSLWLLDRQGWHGFIVDGDLVTA